MIGKFINKAGEEFEVFIDDGTDKEITLVPDAVIINYNGDDIFKPLKCSGATIKCYVDEYMFDLYSGQYDTKVRSEERRVGKECTSWCRCVWWAHK